MFLKTAYLKQQFVPFEQANVSIATQALHYGTAAFGGIRGIVKGNEVILFRLPEHVRRLHDSAKLLRCGEAMTEEYLEQTILEFIQKNKPTSDFYIRPLIYMSDLGVVPKIHDSNKDLLIYGVELGDYFDQNISVCFSSYVRQIDASMPLRGKISGTYITAALAKSEAIERGFDEAIMLNSQHKVCEGSAMNLFLVRNNILITPDTTQDILEGITRRSIIQMAKDMGLEVQERAVDKTELILADELFLTGTVAKATVIKKIEGYQLPAQTPVADQIVHRFNQILNGEIASEWITRVSISHA
jgi:branched-chain amino acid aminotransferase